MSGLNKPVSGLNKGLDKVEVTLKWDPSPAGAPDHDLDLIAGTYAADDQHGAPAYLVHFDSRLSPDGTITLNRDSRTGQGFGPDEAMTLELDRLADSYGRVLVGVAIQQGGGRVTFGDVEGASVHITKGESPLEDRDFAGLDGFTAAVVAEFVRNSSGEWTHIDTVRGLDADPASFAARMGETGA